MAPMNDIISKLTDPQLPFLAGQDEVFDVSMIFDPVCDTMLNFTKCMYATGLIDRSVMVPILQVLPQEMLSYCQSQGIFTGVPEPGPPEPTGKLTYKPMKSETTEPTDKITTEPTTKMMTHIFDTRTEPFEVTIPETGIPEIDRCMAPMNEVMRTLTDPELPFLAGQDEVFDVSMIFDPVCDIMLNFTKCIYATELIDRSVMVPILQVLPQELISYCQSQGIFTGANLVLP